MEVIIVCIGTIVMGYIFDTALGLQLFKDVADEGYKIDIKRYSEFAKANSEGVELNKLLLFPFVNIAFCFWKLAKYNEARPYLIDQLRVIDAIEPFTKEEEEAYKVKPTGLNAMIVPMKTSLNLNKKEIKYTSIDENGNKIIKTFTSLEELYAYQNNLKNHNSVNKKESQKDLDTEKKSTVNEESDRLKEIRAKKQALQEEKETIVSSNNQSPVEKTLKKGTKNLKNQ